MSFEILRPTGAGSLTELAVSGAATNWEAVDEEDPADGDTTRVLRAFAGSEDTPVSDSDTDSYVCGNPTLRDGTITSLEVAIVSKSTVVSGTKYQATPAIYIAPTTYLDVVPGISTGYTTRIGRWNRNPSTGAPWTMADLDSVEIGVRHAVVSGVTPVTISTTQVYGIVNVFSSWDSVVNSQSAFLHEASCAFRNYLTNTDLTPTSVDECCTFLSQYEWECTGRDASNYAQARFPRIHVFTDRVETDWLETQSIHIRATTTLRVWTAHINPTTAASTNAEIVGAIMSALEQLPYAVANYAGGITDTVALRSKYANWGSLAIRITGPAFVPDGSEAGLCLGIVEVTWNHTDI